ncbi:phosphoribosylglycinamide formyltransferase [Nonlabens ponticola]|uniref:Phosphoribosylglycinamide formyltransferase n=1 Tax=Nonlabens ponticola TaxID=2496866 RepID=A0A3S9MVX2_9FLAO|nr:phosphoribosylglycinamide formyltransferase [Nonlabens ponticola]AZQ43375.1 phosphoribosylglycinamide formyltransferase [Nonlabens ponticola]
MKKIVVFASGGGSNAQAIMDHFKDHKQVQVSLILSNNPRAGVLDRARAAGIEALSFNKYAFAKANSIHTLLQHHQPDLIVLAGFLWKVPQFLIEDFPNKIVNIHPALLPKYGGKGMYGKHVHEAVVQNGEAQSGITIHYVNEHYDEGAIIKQATCDLQPDDNAQEVASKVLALEHKYYPQVIENLLSDHGDQK